MIPTDDFNEPDTYDYQSERETDLHYLIARLGFRDLMEFPWTYRSRKLQWVTFRGIILKGFVYKRDFLEFLDHPLARIAKARYVRHRFRRLVLRLRRRGSESCGPADRLAA